MKIEYKNTDSLLLDPENDRFAELYSGSRKEADLIEYLLFTESAEEIAANISEFGYYDDAVLWVFPKGNKFVVKDGNRRCAAVKSLRHPTKFGLTQKKQDVKQLPVLVFKDEAELGRRIQEQHTHSLFREWERIAKALKAYQMYKGGATEDSIREIDSTPSQLIKLASFYYEAVKIGGDDLKLLIRRGRGQYGGKTIIFERLFSLSKKCGYQFKNKPSYEIQITDTVQFNSYVRALVDYLRANPKTTHKAVDNDKESFLKKLEGFGFIPQRSTANGITPEKDPQPETQTQQKKGVQDSIDTTSTFKKKPSYSRKATPRQIKAIVDECYTLSKDSFPNAKHCFTRVMYESLLKFVLEQTKHSGKSLSSYPHFRNAFFDKSGNRRPYTNFTELHTKFGELILDIGLRKAFQNLNLEGMHQAIHNYRVIITPQDAETAAINMIDMVEFMLQDESDFLNSLDLKKL